MKTNFYTDIQMSLLGNQVYANADTPIWLSATGGTIDGNVLIRGNLQVLTTGPGTGAIECNELVTNVDVQTGEYKFVGPGGTTSSFITTANPNTPTESMVLSSTQEIDFVKGSGAANTRLVLSAPGSNLDNLIVGGNVTMNSMSAGSQMAGTGSIALGANNVVIPSTKVAANSLIFLTHVGPAVAGPGSGPAQGNLTYRPADIVPGVSFTVYLTDITGISINAATQAATFVWMIVNPV
jgi:hypothetical protein